jgi:hypothetical protein
MIYVYLTVVIILLITLKPKYLGIFGCMSLGNALSRPMVMNIRYSVLIALIIWMIYQYLGRVGYFKEEYENQNMGYAATQTAESGYNTSSPDTFQYSSAALDGAQQSELCRPGSTLSNEQRNIVCNSGSPGVAALMSAPGIFDPSQLSSSMDGSNMQPSPLYYEPGTVQYGGMGYVPSYEQAAYNNDFKFKDQPTPIVNSFSSNSGFCNDSSMMGNIETKCNSLSKDVCATTSCCVLVGGEKCVEGGVIGPKRKSIYSDTTIKNRDAYYYQGKCYGNCV